MVAPGMPVATVIDIGQVRVELSVSDEEIVKVEKGQRAMLRTNAYPDRRLEGTVSYAGLKADP